MGVECATNTRVSTKSLRSRCLMKSRDLLVGGTVFELCIRGNFGSLSYAGRCQLNGYQKTSSMSMASPDFLGTPDSTCVCLLLSSPSFWANAAKTCSAQPHLRNPRPNNLDNNDLTELLELITFRPTIQKDHNKHRTNGKQRVQDNKPNITEPDWIDVGVPTDLDVNVGHGILMASWNYTSNCVEPSRSATFYLMPYDEFGQQTGSPLVTATTTKDITFLTFRKCRPVFLGVRPIYGHINSVEARKQFTIPAPGFPTNLTASFLRGVLTVSWQYVSECRSNWFVVTMKIKSRQETATQTSLKKAVYSSLPECVPLEFSVHGVNEFGDGDKARMQYVLGGSMRFMENRQYDHVGSQCTTREGDYQQATWSTELIQELTDMKVVGILEFPSHNILP
ncbi:hypothetical protein CLF_109303 [Clonorchis sinensis]|uniref:Uncharacterized protein n=1 Tax=Clonorchis sinensis TaxID=79923 RepID=G7YJ71_CLOSI|nr:hypothetical protein CLF_109303 [Clonorchis sinensis]